jgi:hypothetical protein|tara:strand:+ start:4131 stop:4235 length:105 start_codon:yes stop_codon:yes gene_type:complete
MGKKGPKAVSKVNIILKKNNTSSKPKLPKVKKAY